MKKVLIVGESWTVQETHVKGFDTVDLGRLEQDSSSHLVEALKNAGIEVDYLPSHLAQYHFPDTVEQLNEYSAIALSDIGSNTIMMDPIMQFQGIRKPNRMLTPLAEILPVEMLNYDDRMEHPEGIVPTVVKADHPVLSGTEGEWPWFLGYNKIKAKPEAEEIAVIGKDDTFMASMEVGKGRTFAFASDCAMHWGSKAFLAWDGYQKVMPNIFKWLAKEI